VSAVLSGLDLLGQRFGQARRHHIGAAQAGFAHPPHLPGLDPDQGRGQAEGEGDGPAQPGPTQERTYGFGRNGRAGDMNRHDAPTLTAHKLKAELTRLEKVLRIANNPDR
jgi:hypothetical protein